MGQEPADLVYHLREPAVGVLDLLCFLCFYVIDFCLHFISSLTHSFNSSFFRLSYMMLRLHFYSAFSYQLLWSLSSFKFLVFCDLALKNSPSFKTENIARQLESSSWFGFLPARTGTNATVPWHSRTGPDVRVPPATEILTSCVCSFRSKCKEGELNS